MRTKKYIQRINGTLTSITLMPTYGTLSYLYSEKVGLPRTISRDEHENILQFRKRVNRIKLGIESKLRKLNPVSNTGIWEMDKQSRVNNVRHDYPLSELNKHG